MISCCRENIVIEPQAFDVSTCQTLEKNFLSSVPQRHLTGPSTFKARKNITIRTNIVLNGPMTFKASNVIDVGPNVTLNGGGISLIAKEIKITSGILRPGVDMKTESAPTDCPVQLIAEDEAASRLRRDFQVRSRNRANCRSWPRSPCDVALGRVPSGPLASQPNSPHRVDRRQR